MTAPAWHLIMAVDPHANAALAEWAQRSGGAAVQAVDQIETAGDLPPRLAQIPGPVAILASTQLPDLPQWAAVWAAVGRQRSAPTRCVLLAEGTDDGAPGDLGSLAGTPLAEWARIMTGTESEPGVVQFDYEAIAQALWGAGGADPAPSPASLPHAEPTAVPAGSRRRPPLRLPGIGRRPSPAPAPTSVPTTARPPAEPPPPHEIRVVLPPARLIVVAGGKGGIGKSTIAAGLIAAAAEAYGGCVGLDMDFLKPNLALHFWPEGEALPDLGWLFDQIDVARGGGGGSEESEFQLLETWSHQLSPPQTAPRAWVVPGPLRNKLYPAQPPTGFTRTMLRWALARTEPVVVVDVDPSFEETPQVVYQQAESDGIILLVTTPEYDAVLETDRLYRQITEGLGVPRDRLALVINHRGAKRGSLSAPSIARDHLHGLPVLAEVPWMPQRTQAALGRHTPLQWPQAPWGRVLAACTGRVPQAPRRGWFRGRR